MLRSQFQHLALSLGGISIAALLASTNPMGLLAQDGVVETPDEEVVKEEEEDEQPLRVPVTGWAISPEWEPLLGTWTLMNFAHPTAPIEPDSIRGYLTVSEGFLNMIIHARPADGGQNESDFPDHLAQAGLHRWRISDQGILQLANVMGHSNFGYELQWELPNEPREFRPVLDKDNLTLTRPDFGVLTFRRVTSADFPQAALTKMRELGDESE